MTGNDTRNGRFASKLSLERLEGRDVPGETLCAVMNAIVGDGWLFAAALAPSDIGISADIPGSDRLHYAGLSRIQDSPAAGTDPSGNSLNVIGDPLNLGVSDRVGRGLTSSGHSDGVAIGLTEGGSNSDPFDLDLGGAFGWQAFGSDDRLATVRPITVPRDMSPLLAGSPTAGSNEGIPESMRQEKPVQGGQAASNPPSDGSVMHGPAAVPVAQVPANRSGAANGANSAGVVGAPVTTRTIPPAGDASSFAEVGSGDGGSDTSPIEYFSCQDGNMTASDDLWYFGGGTIANYPTTITLTVSNIPEEATSITWTVTNGYDKALFVGATDLTATISQDGPFSGSSSTVQLRSIDWSDEEGDITVVVDWSSGVSRAVGNWSGGADGLDPVGGGGQLSGGVLTSVTAFNLMPWAPAPWGVHEKDLPYTADVSHWPGYKSFIFYQIGNQFGRVLPRQIAFNEYFVPNTYVADYDPLGHGYGSTTWYHDDPNSSFGDAADVWDIVGYSAAAYDDPQSQEPNVPLGNEKVEHWTQEFWVGDMRPGHGWLVQRNTLQRYVDHGRHENIVNAHAWNG